MALKVSQSTYFSVSAEDRPGELAQFMVNLREHGLDLAGLWGFSLGDSKAQIIIVAKDPERFREIVSSTTLRVMEGECVRLEGDDRVGILHEVLSRIAGENINIHAIDAVSVDKNFACYLWSDENRLDEIRAIVNSEISRIS